ncbi:hypothetical protein [Halalkalibacter krulwichiae]|uniref:Uncharacterized protein n=1 Tax=Halalkalibacter krulwichiae TaxID=199441 RepID=A0A1X9MHV6_9BACI|nr:hypothetical protein [Halalkalibacter krulwichiae]ARK32180.1 hypothetical protein BkAM31D_21305 [Halalkalibacter krulwichiae]
MIKITGIKVGNYPIKVPQGLSELVHQANAWAIPKEEKVDEEYHRQIVMDKGRLSTILTRKEDFKKEA